MFRCFSSYSEKYCSDPCHTKNGIDERNEDSCVFHVQQGFDLFYFFWMMSLLLLLLLLYNEVDSAILPYLHFIAFLSLDYVMIYFKDAMEGLICK